MPKRHQRANHARLGAEEEACGGEAEPRARGARRVPAHIAVCARHARSGVEERLSLGADAVEGVGGAEGADGVRDLLLNGGSETEALAGFAQAVRTSAGVCTLSEGGYGAVVNTMLPSASKLGRAPNQGRQDVIKGVEATPTMLPPVAV